MQTNLSNERIANLEYEKHILSSMLLKEGEIIPEVAAILTPDDFYRPEHKLVFGALLKIYNEKKPVNLLTLAEDLKASNLLDNGKIDTDFIFYLAEIAETTAYATFYAQDVKEKSELRKLQMIAEQISFDALQGIKSPLNIIAETNNAFNSFNSKENVFTGVCDYAVRDFFKDVEKDQQYFGRKTGFSNIDEPQNFLPGLYILGGTPACGKTTFAWQLLEQIAMTGENCIFCSYEMSKPELVSKTLARRLFLCDPSSTLTAADIRNGGYSRNLDDVVSEFFEEKLKFTVREFSDETVDKLLAVIRPIVNNSDKAPVVCIDYLQRLIPRDHKSGDTRALIDDALYKLKDFSKETKTTFICVSTFNRTNYNQAVSYESFKESGGIEYTADVIWALQLNIANFLSGEKETVIRQKIDAAKRQQPREIQLSCLKNRNGNNYNCFFQYYSAHDYFLPCLQSDFITQKKSTNDEDENEGRVS